MDSSVPTDVGSHGALYTLWFSIALSLVAATIVSSSYVALRDRQQANLILARQTSVLRAAGLLMADEAPSRTTIESHFEPIRRVVLDLQTGEEVTDIDP